MQLQLGIAREVITPEIGGQLYGYSPDVYSTTVADDLTVTALYFVGNGTEALMISVTVCSVQTELARRLVNEISQKVGVAAEHIVIAATHTHSAPNTTGSIGWGAVDQAYCENILIPRMVAAAEHAVQNPRAVTMFAAQGESSVGINRRQWFHDGAYIGLGQNLEGTFDPTMTVLSFRDEHGATVANLIHYGCHGTAAGMNNEITRDWSGVMVDALETATGGITAFFNGAEGDIGPRLSNGMTTGDLSHVYELGKRAADDVLRIYATAEEKCADLSVKAVDVGVPLKPRMDKETAEQQLERYRGETVNLSGLARYRLENTLHDIENNIEEDTHFTFRQTVLRLGDVVFVSYPFEPFCDIAMRVKAAAKDKTVLVLSNTGGSEGYVVTEEALSQGGYEVGMHTYGHRQALADNADTALVLATIENINEI